MSIFYNFTRLAVAKFVKIKITMSNLNNGADVGTQVAHNVYFDGKVKSLVLETSIGRATVGVMKKGEYQFSTSTVENITIIAGTMNTKFTGERWIARQPGERFKIEANVFFDVTADSDVAYICYYKD